MTNRQSFAECERLGREDAAVVNGYDAHLSRLTTQSIPHPLREARVQPGTRLLDVATGGGYVAAAASELGADAVGIDFSAAQIRLARARHPSTRFQQADAQALPFALK